MLTVIELTRFNGTKFYLNADLVEYIEATPDTVITLSSGKRHLVKEDVLTIKHMNRFLLRHLYLEIPKQEKFQSLHLEIELSTMH